ncbi:MAG: molybdenum cofactor biosynthesis protein MoaE [Ottowia sp.]|uniref:molybdenum cofactor biosynthesis protein MoaE n=1 Tax=Ottowia sp. TaxID=1898956 RepID=UPI0039E353EF
MPAPRVSIQTGDFDLAAEVAALRAGDGRVGAVCSFVGMVRDRNSVPTLPAARGSLPSEGALSPWGGPAATGEGDAVSEMELEHYPGMTEKAIEAMIDEAQRRFDILGARVVHRVGRLRPQEQIVLVAVASPHRGQAFQACEFLMDYLKTQAPFWKKETTPAGARWVDARVADDAALARWGLGSRNA